VAPDGLAGTDPYLARVLRGGAFSNDNHNCRGAVRNRNNPHNRNDNGGFRVVWSTLSGLSPHARIETLRDGPAGTDCRDEENGGVRSWPRPVHRPGHIAFWPAPSARLSPPGPGWTTLFLTAQVQRLMYAKLAGWDNLLDRPAPARSAGR